MNAVVFNPGFRLSILDIGVLMVGSLGAWFLRAVEVDLSYMLIFVVGHFFYFCNIVRMSRMPELIWASCFVVITGFGVSNAVVSLTQSFLISFAITIILTILELRKPSYHGVLWSKVNPDLKEWFESKRT